MILYREMMNILSWYLSNMDVSVITMTNIDNRVRVEARFKYCETNYVYCYESTGFMTYDLELLKFENHLVQCLRDWKVR